MAKKFIKSIKVKGIAPLVKLFLVEMNKDLHGDIGYITVDVLLCVIPYNLSGKQIDNLFEAVGGDKDLWGLHYDSVHVSNSENLNYNVVV